MVPMGAEGRGSAQDQVALLAVAEAVGEAQSRVTSRQVVQALAWQVPRREDVLR